jgi:hypothetical protein
MTPSTKANAKVSSTSTQNPNALPLRDGDASQSSREPPDGTTKVVALSGDQEPDLSGTQEKPMPGQRQLQHHENDTAQAQHHQNDDDASDAQRSSDIGPKSPHKNSTGHESTQGEPSDADTDASETSDTFHLTMSSRHHAMLRPKKVPEVALGKDHNDIDKFVMAIGSLITTINESCKSKLRFHENEQKHHESK